MFRFRGVVLSILTCFALLTPASVLGVNRYFLPQAAAGTSGNLTFVTQISVLNTGPSASDVIMRLRTDAGLPWSVKTSCAENVSLNHDSAWELDFSMSAGRKYAILLGPTGNLSVGWVEFQSEHPLQISATYGFYEAQAGGSYKPFWEAAVLPSRTAEEQTFAAHLKGDDMVAGVDTNTGFAVANPSTISVTVTAKLYNHANELVFTKQFDIPAHGHRAQFINELFELNSSNFRGKVRFSSEAGIAGLAMKEAKWATGVVYSTVPVEADSQFAIHTDYDVESNSLDNARTIDTPSEIYGTVNESEENVFADSYEIRLAAGETLDVLLLAGSLGSSLHPNLLIRTIGNSTPLGTVEELFTGSYDRKATFTASQLGVFYIVVSHYESTGGPGAFYRLFVRKH